ncbi:MAG: lytic transglycosylase domain-containing protein [Bryobacteraceae bacterium]
MSARLHASPRACVNNYVRGLCALLAVCLPVLAGEYAVLKSGFRIYAERHEVTGAEVCLYTPTGHIVLAGESVARFEAEDYTPPPAPAPVVEPSKQVSNATPKELVRRAARGQDLEDAFVPLAESVAKIESAFQRDAISPKGAVGVMQLMPSTAAELGANPYDAEQNVEAGVRHLRDLLVRYQDKDDQVRWALAAYNAGAGAVERYQGIPPYRETRLYVEKVLDEYRKRKAARADD